MADKDFVVKNGLVVGANNTTFGTAVSLVSNGNVGIGNSTPTTKLHIQRAPGASIGGEIWSGDGTYWTQLNSRQSAGSYNPLVAASDHALIYSDGTSETGSLVIGQWSSSARGIRIDASGNVGIGTASPAQKLDVTSSTNTSAILIHNALTGSTATDGFELSVGDTASWVWNYENTPIIFGANNAESMRITAAGNIGIGTASPTQKLDVTGSITATANVSAASINASTGFYGTVQTATQATIDHNTLANYVADRHIAHSGVSITAGTGLSGGGTIDASRTLNVTNVPNSVTFNNGGVGAVSGTTFNGSSAVTISYNSIGAPSTTGTNASGTWSININGSSGSTTTATTATNVSGGTVSATTGSFSSDLSFNSGYGSAAVAYGCRSWIRFLTSLGTPSITASGNVTSITDNGTGAFTINFTTALVDANYGAVANYTETNSATGSGNDGQASCHTHATGSVRVFCARGDGSSVDPARCTVVVFR